MPAKTQQPSGSRAAAEWQGACGGPAIVASSAPEKDARERSDDGQSENQRLAPRLSGGDKTGRPRKGVPYAGVTASAPQEAWWRAHAGSDGQSEAGNRALTPFFPGAFERPTPADRRRVRAAGGRAQRPKRRSGGRAAAAPDATRHARANPPNLARAQPNTLSRAARRCAAVHTRLRRPPRLLHPRARSRRTCGGSAREASFSTSSEHTPHSVPS